MDVLLTIGEFSKMTYLSVKALRHYHEVGLLEPADVDPSTGYRLYAARQVGTAQAIRRFRDLDMPLEQVRAVLEAPDADARNRAIVEHLEHMQRQLQRTQLTVASLQALLEAATPAGTVDYRTLSPARTLAISDIVVFDDIVGWCDETFAELHQSVTSSGLTAAGADGALYFDDFFEVAEGRVVAFVPLAGDHPVEPIGRTAIQDLPATRVAVMTHTGLFTDLDQTYGALGTFVAERGIGLPGPIREHYLTDDTTEVCWPITNNQGATP